MPAIGPSPATRRLTHALAALIVGLSLYALYAAAAGAWRLLTDPPVWWGLLVIATVVVFAAAYGIVGLTVVTRLWRGNRSPRVLRAVVVLLAVALVGACLWLLPEPWLRPMVAVVPVLVVAGFYWPAADGFVRAHGQAGAYTLADRRHGARLCALIVALFVWLALNELSLTLLDVLGPGQPYLSFAMIGATFVLALLCYRAVAWSILRFRPSLPNDETQQSAS